MYGTCDVSVRRFESCCCAVSNLCFFVDSNARFSKDQNLKERLNVAGYRCTDAVGHTIHTGVRFDEPQAQITFPNVYFVAAGNLSLGMES